MNYGERGKIVSIVCRWIGVRLQLLASILILAASVFALLTEDLSGGQVGLSLTYAFQVSHTLPFTYILLISFIIQNYLTILFTF